MSMNKITSSRRMFSEASYTLLVLLPPKRNSPVTKLGRCFQPPDRERFDDINTNKTREMGLQTSSRFLSAAYGRVSTIFNDLKTLCRS